MNPTPPTSPRNGHAPVTRPANARRRGRMVLAAWLSVCLGAAQASLLSEGYQARYAVSRDGLPLGESVRTLRPLAGDRWRFDARAAPTGLAAILFDDVIDEHSEMRLRDDLVAPTRYSYDQHGGRKDKAYALRFDWTASVLHFEHSDGQMPMPSGTQDPLSFLVVVMQRLMRGDKAFDLTIAGRNKLRDYRVALVDRSEMGTVLGRQVVVKVEAQEVGKDTRYELWCLPARDYLPLRIRQVRGRQVTDLRLREVTSPPPPATP